MSDSESTTAASDRIANASVAPAEQLLRLWEQGIQTDLDAFLKTAGHLSVDELTQAVRVDQFQRWQAGERIPAERYLSRYPDVRADGEAAVDVIFHEFLLRTRLGEGPEVHEYVGRFPAYADVLEGQIALQRALQRDQPIETVPVPDGSTASFPSHRISPGSRPAGNPPAFSARGGLSSSREVQTLLRQRLRILSVLCCVLFILISPIVWTFVTSFWGAAVYCLVIAETGLFAALLSSRRPFSMAALRWIEAGIMGTLMLYDAWEQIQFFQAGVLSSLADRGLIGPDVAARSNSWSWAILMMVYGVWIPNTARRAIIAVVAMLIGFMAVTLGLALTAPPAPPGAVATFVWYSTTHITGAAVIAIFGAYRIQTLQRAVSEARKLGPYRLIKRLGAGGMGEVYLAEHALLRRSCALKLIRAEQGGDERSLTRFEREVQTMSSLTHPNTVRVYDYGRAADGTFYYAMEYLPGLSLDELVKRHGTLPPARAVHLLRQVCGALREAHAVGLVHRDIKPANILACQIGGIHDVVKLLDFGLVRVHNPGNDAHSLTGIGAIAGTPAFMSPEQAAGTNEVDRRSDIYSLGTVAYFLLTGRPPFVRSTSVETMAAHLTESVALPRQLCPEIPFDLEEIVMHCMQKEPEQRFQDIVAVEEALARCACSAAWTWEQAANWWRGRDVIPSNSIDTEPNELTTQ